METIEGERLPREMNCRGCRELKERLGPRFGPGLTLAEPLDLLTSTAAGAKFTSSAKKVRRPGPSGPEKLRRLLLKTGDKERSVW